MNIAIECANRKGVPVILDPVGAGATAYRSDVAKSMLKRHKISVLKGNLGEISSLAGLGGVVSGVDSLGGGEPEAVVSSAWERFSTITAVTGKHDYVFNGRDMYVIKNDSGYLPRITGSGCMAGSIVAAFISMEKDWALAAACALAIYSMAGELTEKDGVKGPADFRMKFIDMVYGLDPSIIEKNVRIEKKTV
jgi:hydroxyethylthiazole kinase